jgi:DNA-binding CsgD family transcriptional regulator
MQDASLAIREILHLAHHAAGDPSLWDEVMVRLGVQFDAPLMALIDHNFLTHQGEINHAAGMDERFRTLYGTRFSGKNVWLNVERRFAPGEVFTGAELVPNWELVRTEFYREWLHPLRAFHCLIGFTFGYSEDVRSLVALRPLHAAPFDAQSKGEFGSLLLQMRCACELDAELAAARRKTEILSDVVQALSEAVFIVDGECHPVFVNGAAKGLLAEGGYLGLSHGMLAAASGHETGRLRRLVAKAAGYNRDGTASSNGEIAVTCLSGAPPLILRIKAIPHSAIDKGGKPKKVVAIFAGTSEMAETAQQLYDFYRFTPAEARLAALIVSGYSLHTAARKLCVSRNTARTHMKRIYDKTATHRQVDLIRLVANRAAPPH